MDSTYTACDIAINGLNLLIKQYNEAESLSTEMDEEDIVDIYNSISNSLRDLKCDIESQAWVEGQND